MNVPSSKAMAPTCSHCGSNQIIFEAQMVWDVAGQQWLVADIFDRCHCHSCGTAGGVGEAFTWEEAR